MATANYYSMFALEQDASDVEIKRRYRELSLKHHPDRGGSADKMIEINEAYSVLSNSLLRREYDKRNAANQTVAGSYDDFVHTPARYARSTSSQTSPRHHEQTAKSSIVWLWLGLVGGVLFCFIAFQLYEVVKSPADTGGDMPGSSTVRTHASVHRFRPTE